MSKSLKSRASPAVSEDQGGDVTKTLPDEAGANGSDGAPRENGNKVGAPVGTPGGFPVREAFRGDGG